MGTVRITSGFLRGRRVETPPGDETRPLLTRLRKSLADILRPRLAGASVLDLFAGSGAVAFELLSNGAERAVAVEKSGPVARLILENAGRLGVTPRIRVVRADALRALDELGTRGERFDVVLIMPPYWKGYQEATLNAVWQGRVLAPGGVVVVQRHRKEPVAAAPDGLVRVRTRVYGRTAFDFYESCEDPPAGQRARVRGAES